MRRATFAGQLDLVEHLHGHGCPLDAAESPPGTLQQTLAMMRDRVQRLEAEVR
jgi:hypothetical protein